MPSPSEKDQALFAWLVQSYTTQAMVCLGKLANPMTGKEERDLDQASMMIDILSMIEKRTQGNLTAEEEGMLQQALSTLRLNYVDERKRGDEPEAGNGEDAPDAEGSKDDADDGTETAEKPPAPEA